MDWLTSLFQGPPSGQMRDTMSAVLGIAPANLASQYFTDNYRTMWAVTLILAVPLICWLIFKAMRPEDRDDSLGALIRVIVALPVLGMVIPGILWSIQMAFSYANDLLISWTGKPPDFNFWDRFFAPQENSVDGIRSLVNFFCWIFSALMQAEAFLMVNLVLWVGPISILAALLYIAGGYGAGFGAAIINLTLVSLASQTAIVLVLVGGITLMDATTDPAHLSIGIAVSTAIILGLAAFSPYLLYRFGTRPLVRLGGGRATMRTQGSKLAVRSSGFSGKVTAYANRAGSFAKQAVNRQPGSPPVLPRITSISSAAPGQKMATTRRIVRAAGANRLIKAAATKSPATAAAYLLAAKAVRPGPHPKLPSRPPASAASIESGKS